MATYLLNSFRPDSIKPLAHLVNLVRLALVDQARSRQLQPRHDILPLLQRLELGIRNGLLDVFCSDLSARNLANGADRGRGCHSHALRRARDRNVKQSGVRVRCVCSADIGAGTRSFGLREQREARGPLDAGLPAQEGCEDLEFRLVCRSRGEGRRAVECQDHGVSSIVRDALLTAIVSRGGTLGGGKGFRRARRAVGEELLDPIAEIGMRGAVGDDDNVGLGVGDLREGLQALNGEVFCQRGRRGRMKGCAEATVEGNTVGRVESEGFGRAKEVFLRYLDDREDFFVEFMAYVTLDDHRKMKTSTTLGLEM